MGEARQEFSALLHGLAARVTHRSPVRHPGVLVGLAASRRDRAACPGRRKALRLRLNVGAKKKGSTFVDPFFVSVNAGRSILPMIPIFF